MGHLRGTNKANKSILCVKNGEEELLHLENIVREHKRLVKITWSVKSLLEIDLSILPVLEHSSYIKIIFV